MVILDISVPISNRLPTYEGDPGVEIARTEDMDAGALYNLSRLSFGAHTGTHVDAPQHFIRTGTPVDELDLNVLIGPVRVLDMTHVEESISARDLKDANLPRGVKRLLFKTRNSALWKKPSFQRNFVAFAPDAAQWLVDYGARLVGIDYLSVDAFDSADFGIHQLFLKAGIVIVEGLDLAKVEAGSFQLICLPLRLEGLEGAPARAVLAQ